VVVDTVDIGSSVVKGPALRAGGLELLVANDGPANALGVGVCGACTNYRVESLTVRSDGTFGELVELVSHLVTDDQTMDLTIAPDLSTVVLRGDQVDHSTEPPRVEGFELRLTWSPAQGEYVARKRSVAARPIP
jgi:hypothetical protein